MIATIARRLAAGVLVLLVVSVVAFLVFETMPAGDPARARAGRLASEADVARVRATLHLDEPAPRRYARFVERLVLHGDLGHSYVRDTDVRAEILDRVPATVALAGGALAVWSLAGLLIGLVGALRPKSVVDRTLNAGALLLMSAPPFWLGLVALLLVADDVGVLPLLPGSGSYPLEGTLWTNPAEVAPSLVLPSLALAAGFAAVQGRLLRAQLRTTLRRDYSRTARAKGVPERTVVLRHALPPASTPVLSAAGVQFAALLGGAVLVESAFNLPGLGRLSIEAAAESDLPMLEGTMLVGAAAVVALNLAVDVAYALLDPRIRR